MNDHPKTDINDDQIITARALLPIKPGQVSNRLIVIDLRLTALSAQ